jgi:dihydrofolate synthase/folylpolyglutamate synthase
LQGEVYQETWQAVIAARSAAKPQDMIFIGGSTFVVAEVLKYFPDGF